MATKTIYCSACDREVLVKLKQDGTLDGSVCMDIGELCTGTMCPICAESPDVIREQVRKLENQK
jgi:hypothetical protein